MPSVTCLALALAFVATAAAQTNPLLPETATRVSDHVHAILGWPNVAIVTGSRAVLVVDTGLGTRNGATVTRVVNRLAPNTKLFLTTTHFHPEHAGGEPGFPPGTVLIRDLVQQDEMDRHGTEMLQAFSKRSAENADLLAGVKLRPPDILFDRELKLDLGGVTARIMWLGPGHTKGDELIFIEPDRALISGDIVQNRLVPAIPGGNGSLRGWVEILNKVAPLNPRYVVPDHGELGDGALIEKERTFITDLQTRALQLKAQGVSADDAGKQLTAEFRTKYADWPNLNPLPNLVRQIYQEAQ